MAQPKNKQPAAQSKPTAKPAPKAASVGTAIEVLQYCESSTATQAAKLTYLEANVSGIFKDLLATLMGQVSYRAPGSVAPDPKEYIQRMYMLHNVLIGILENPDDAERTALLHVVNLVFEQYGGHSLLTLYWSMTITGHGVWTHCTHSSSSWLSLPS